MLPRWQATIDGCRSFIERSRHAIVTYPSEIGVIGTVDRPGIDMVRGRVFYSVTDGDFHQWGVGTAGDSAIDLSKPGEGEEP